MPVERFFIDQEMHINSDVELSGKEYHHLANVIRVAKGDVVDLVNGRGQLASAEVVDVKKKHGTLHIHDLKTEPRRPFEVILAQSIPRSNRLDFILEKGTELGMTKLWLFPGVRSERKKLSEHQIERMRTIAISAMKQCGRLYLPDIAIKPSLDQWDPPPYTSFFGDLDPNAKILRHVWGDIDLSSGVIFFIGPESGFSEAEEATLKGLNAQGVKLHPNILRTDTAALTALSVIEHQILT